MHLNTQPPNKWMQKRKYTFIAFSIQIIIIGMEYSLTFLTLWLYIKEMMNTKTPKLFYSLVSVSYMLTSSILTPFIGRFVDRNRNVSICFLICNMLMFIGNIFYSLPFSPYFLIGGRVIAGFGGTLKSVIVSETIRSYPASEISSKLSILSVMKNLGYMVAPGINFFFKGVNFSIGRWHLKDLNFPGFFMGLICVIMEVVTITMVHNLSKEFDYKALEDKNEADVIEIEVSKIEKDKKPPILQNNDNENSVLIVTPKEHTVVNILKKLFFHIDSALILFSSFFLAFFLVNTDIWLPLLVIEKMHLSITEMNISFLGSGVFCALSLLLFMWKPLTDKKMILLLLIGLGCFCIISAGFVILSLYPFNKALNVVFCVVYMIGFGVAPIITDVFLINALAKMVNSNVLTFVDGIRSSMFFGGAFLAFASSAFLFDYVEIFGTAFVVVMILIGIFFSIRKSNLLYPELLL
ncbi:uncharacterized protein LOC105846782 isoform X1 [Hydra vulgaris]|uniref:uncharacterized protein LOC105846782 isoform X1 n=1 Tax=Hydra vulgaris TaxID=6087 RepID=UPI001F5FDE4C|nr:uncharacterized protein LOC105846782 [Hydra vulgaris]